MPTVAQVLETVEHTPGSAGLLPIEDSYEGEALSVYDRLVFESWHAYIRDEVVVSDSLDAFAVSPDAKEAAHTAVSSPRGIEHCFRFVQEQGLDVRYADSTTEACRAVADRRRPRARRHRADPGRRPSSGSSPSPPASRTCPT